MYAAIYLCAGNEKIFYDTQQTIFDVHKTAGAIQIQFEFHLFRNFDKNHFEARLRGRDME